jgi:hypothetical protein
LQTCAACGTETDDQDCPDCGRELARTPDVDIVEDDPEYDFDGTSAAERVEATDLLVGARVPYRWDRGYTLRVPADREEDVDTLFGHGSPTDALDELRSAAAALADGEEIDDPLVMMLADAVGVVTMTEAPAGVHPLVWATAGFVARQLMAVVDGGDAEAIGVAAQLALAVLDLQTA